MFGALLVLAALTAGPDERASAVKGTVTYVGEFPLRCHKLRGVTGSDACTQARNGESFIETETFILNRETRALKNVIVYVKMEVETESIDPPDQSVKLFHEGCVFVPHVLTLQVRQKLEIRNNDGTLHHHHVHSGKNLPLNFNWPTADVPRFEEFKIPEIFPIKCDVHPWENAIIGVFDHPYHAVTDKDGNFEIKGLPVGECTLVAWHEEMGEAATVKVTLGGGETKEANIEIKGK